MKKREVITRARPIEDWAEEDGPVLWWKFPVTEPPYVGTPLDVGQTVNVTMVWNGGCKEMNAYFGGWPGYHTHWTPIEVPSRPGWKKGKAKS